MNVLKFKKAHFIAQQNLSMRTFKPLCLLDKSKGLDTGESYINNKSCALIMQHSAAVEQRKTRDMFKDSSFVGVTCDGTSNFTGDKYESVFIKMALNGKITE